MVDILKFPVIKVAPIFTIRRLSLIPAFVVTIIMLSALCVLMVVIGRFCVIVLMVVIIIIIIILFIYFMLFLQMQGAHSLLQAHCYKLCTELCNREVLCCPAGRNREVLWRCPGGRNTEFMCPSPNGRNREVLSLSSHLW